jgi:7,8-dihydroneopterin aldolase/epimerase/oxygenase
LQLQTYLKIRIKPALPVEIDKFASQNQSNMATIILEGMEFFAYHGHYKEEQIIGTKFFIDVEFDYESEAAEKSDHLQDAMNYLEVFQVVRNEMEITSHLLEHVARRILSALRLSFPGMIKARVKIAKMNPQLGGKVKQVSCVLSY